MRNPTDARLPQETNRNERNRKEQNRSRRGGKDQIQKKEKPKLYKLVWIEKKI